MSTDDMVILISMKLSTRQKNLLLGAGTALCLFPASRALVVQRPHAGRTDADALRSDFVRVGMDIQRSMDRVRGEEK